MPEFGAPPPDESELYDGPTRAEIAAAVAIPPSNVINKPQLFAGRPPIEEWGQATGFAGLAPEPIGAGLPSVIEPPSQAQYVTTISVALDILNANLLALLALVGALVFWGLAVWAPDQLRLIAATGYSVLVLLPAIFIHVRKT